MLPGNEPSTERARPIITIVAVPGAGIANAEKNSKF
jgi:hypothetical protein